MLSRIKARHSFQSASGEPVMSERGGGRRRAAGQGGEGWERRLVPARSACAPAAAGAMRTTLSTFALSAPGKTSAAAQVGPAASASPCAEASPRAKQGQMLVNEGLEGAGGRSGARTGGSARTNARGDEARGAGRCGRFSTRCEQRNAVLQAPHEASAATPRSVAGRGVAKGSGAGPARCHRAVGSGSASTITTR